jgi:hypothetical protein
MRRSQRTPIHQRHPVPGGCREAVPPLELAVSERQVEAADTSRRGGCEPPTTDRAEQVTQKESMELRVFDAQMWMIEDHNVRRPWLARGCRAVIVVVVVVALGAFLR